MPSSTPVSQSRASDPSTPCKERRPRTEEEKAVRSDETKRKNARRELTQVLMVDAIKEDTITEAVGEFMPERDALKSEIASLKSDKARV